MNINQPKGTLEELFKLYYAITSFNCVDIACLDCPFHFVKTVEKTHCGALLLKYSGVIKDLAKNVKVINP